jgi:hypothetical protein
MTTTILAPEAAVFTLTGLPADVFGSCSLQPPAPAPAPPAEDPIYTPVAPGISYEALPEIVVVDTSPDQIVGCILDTADNAQSRLNALFPDAIAGDGVIERRNNDIWVFDGTEWNNVGPTPGPTIQNLTSIVLPYNETAIYDAQIRLGTVVTKFDYALELLTEVDPLVVTLRAEARRQVGLLIPQTIIALTAQTPSISTGYAAHTPVAQLTLEVIAPALGVNVRSPAASIDLAALQPSIFVNYPPNSVLLAAPVSGIAISSLLASVSTGVSLSPSSATLEILALAPLVNSIDILEGTVAPLLGAGGADDFTGWDRIRNANADDSFIEVANWPFTFNLASTGYTGTFVGSNTYLTFGSGSSAFSNLSASNPGFPKIHFGAADNSYQRVYKRFDTAKDGSSVVRIRYEGAAGTSGALGSPTIVAEFAFYQPRSDGSQWIELRVGNHSRTSGLFMIASATTSYASATIAANSSWVFVGNSTGTSWTMTSNRYIG